MKINDSIFAVKLYEMEEQYGKLQCRIQVCEQEGKDRIKSELEKAENEYKENSLLLEKKVRTCRSRAVEKLSRAQLEYRRKTRSLLAQIPDDVHSEDSSRDEDSSEAKFLYAEYAMDFATLAMQQALICALEALAGGKDPEAADPENIENDKNEKKEEVQCMKKRNREDL